MTQPIITWFNLNKSSEQFNKYSIKQETTYVITPDLFYIDDYKDNVIVFSPLLFRVYYIPKQFVSNTNPLSFHNNNIDELIKANILIPKEVTPTLYPSKPDCSKFNPNIRLLLTTACNLNCVYCYAEANRSTNTNVIIEKLNIFLDSVPTDINSLNIEFHGGEPTVAFIQMRKAHELISQKFPNSTFMIQTNGVFSEEILDWLTNNKVTINFSIDGTEDIHNAQRPAINKRTNSFKELHTNINKAQQKETGTACIVTITEYNLNKMKDIYYYLKENKFKYIKFNPLLKEGRALNSDEDTTTPPDLDVFAKNLAEISLSAFQDKIIIDSDMLPNVHTRQPSFARCGAVCNQTTICPDGEIIACSDAVYLTPDNKDNPFYFATITDSNIEYNKQHEIQLRNSTADNYPLCENCFLRWHCAGGCKIENYLENKDIMVPNIKSCIAKQTFIKEYFRNIGEKIL
jgi:uncharacterized protein